MNAIRSLSRPQLIGAGLACAGLIGAAVVIKVTDTVNNVIGATTISSGLVCLGTTSLFTIQIIKNIAAVIFARYGKFDFADRLLNTRTSVFFNQHVFALAVTASVSCAIALIGILYFDEN